MTNFKQEINALVKYDSKGFSRFTIFEHGYNTRGGDYDIIFSSDDIVTAIKEFDKITNVENKYSYDHLEIYDLKEGMVRVDVDATREEVKDYIDDYVLEEVKDG